MIGVHVPNVVFEMCFDSELGVAVFALVLGSVLFMMKKLVRCKTRIRLVESVVNVQDKILFS